ncbi:hypothetical protein NR798_41695 [Archangium gephyra]
MPSFDAIPSSILEPDASAAVGLGRGEVLACRLATLTGRPVPPLSAR